jgi:hypothetical protein
VKISTIERFERHYIPEPNSGCWIWLGAVRKSKLDYGYFHMGHDLHTVRAHVAAYKLFRGPTNGLHVCHKCDVPSCVNPEHLFLGTAQENINDRERKGRGVRQYGEKHPLSVLIVAEIMAIRADRRATRFIAVDYKINKATVQKIKRRALWGHVA